MAQRPPKAESHAPPPQAINLASGTYMSKQNDINEKMRAILIDWLIEVHLKFKLMIETLYLTVNLIDRFLEKETITRNKLQLVGVTAMFLASKYEEIYAPECRDFVYISDKAYTREQILAMEGAVLAKLNFQLTTPNTYVFLKRFSKVAGIIATPRSKTELLANMFVELTLQARAPALSLSKSRTPHRLLGPAGVQVSQVPPVDGCRVRSLPGPQDDGPALLGETESPFRVESTPARADWRRSSRCARAARLRARSSRSTPRTRRLPCCRACAT